MENPTFDAAETIAGFSLLKIKHALSWVGVMDERDDIALVAEALGCPRPQAQRVLAALERRGFVTPTKVKTQWETTTLGKQLAYHWKRPPKLEPVIAREEDDDEHAINEMFDAVPCSLLRTSADDEDAFEEADLEVGVFVEYASPRVIEISVVIPEDYDNRDSSGTFETSVYVGVEEAKRFAAALQTAIGRAEAELARRAIAKPRKKAPPAEPTPPTPAAAESTPPARSSNETRATAPPKPGAAERAAAAAKKAAERAAEDKRRREQRALEATMKELRGGQRGKRPTE